MNENKTMQLLEHLIIRKLEKKMKKVYNATNPQASYKALAKELTRIGVTRKAASYANISAYFDLLNKLEEENSVITNCETLHEALIYNHKTAE